MLEILVWVQLVTLIVGVPSLLLYVRERVKNVAREETDRALAIQRHQHEQALAAINADHSRRLEEFGLFARKRHSVYPVIYGRFRQASDGYGGLLGFRSKPDFRRYTGDDVRTFLGRQGARADLLPRGRRSGDRVGAGTEAVRRANMELRRHPIYGAHPRFWAAFKLVGH